jgi:uncharacterized membrane protein
MVTRRFRAFVIALTITSIGISGSAAHADVKPTPSPTSKLSPAREQQLREILNDFNRALRKATDDARFAGKSAGSKAALASARAAAATARDEAVALLGPVPEPPTAPMKPMKIAKDFVPSQKPGKKK